MRKYGDILSDLCTGDWLSFLILVLELLLDPFSIGRRCGAGGANGAVYIVQHPQILSLIYQSLLQQLLSTSLTQRLNRRHSHTMPEQSELSPKEIAALALEGVTNLASLTGQEREDALALSRQLMTAHMNRDQQSIQELTPRVLSLASGATRPSASASSNTNVAPSQPNSTVKPSTTGTQKPAFGPPRPPFSKH